MDDILLVGGDSTLMFVIDTKASMIEKISAVKVIAKQIVSITREFKVDYMLSPFNDRGTI